MDRILIKSQRAKLFPAQRSSCLAKARDVFKEQSHALTKAALPVQMHTKNIPPLPPLPILTEVRDASLGNSLNTYSFLLLGINFGSLCIHWLRNLQCTELQIEREHLLYDLINCPHQGHFPRQHSLLSSYDMLTTTLS